MTDKLHFDDIVSIKYEGEFFNAHIKATADYYYDPGCMYMKNGDPGYPPEESIELDKFEVLETEGEDGKPFEMTRELEDAFADALINDLNWEYWISEKAAREEAEAEEMWEL